jgi:hypothetical protein
VEVLVAAEVLRTWTTSLALVSISLPEACNVAMPVADTEVV